MRAHLDWFVPLAAVLLALGATAACGSDDDDSSKKGSGGSGGSGASGGGGSGGSSATGGGGSGGAPGGGGGAAGASGGAAGASGGAAGGGGIAGGASGGTGGGGADIPPDKQNLRLAFIGDTASGNEFKSVLNLIKGENADAIIGLGDYDYSFNPGNWINALKSVVADNYPMFGAMGNHDIITWGLYANEFKARMTANNVTPDNPDLGDERYSIVYQGVKIVFAGQNTFDANGNASFVQSQLAGDNHIWKICAWHKNQQAMQVGGKFDEMGYPVYENCRSAGAIIATAHEHSYSRTKTLTEMGSQTVDTTCSDPSKLCVGAGRSFAFVSGLGGQSIRDQSRCLPATPPYGCKGEWGHIYTSNQNANYGATFIDFYVNGDPKKAKGYFKNIAGTTVDTFEITKD